VTAVLETTDTFARIKELAILKSRGAKVDSDELQSLLDLQRIDRNSWLDAVDRLAGRRKASETIEVAQGQLRELDDMVPPNRGEERERLRKECEAKRDELQLQIDELLKQQREAMQPLADHDSEDNRLVRRIHRLRSSAELSIREARKVLESSADPAIDRRIDELSGEQQSIVQSLGAIIRPQISRGAAEAALNRSAVSNQSLAAVGIDSRSPFSERPELVGGIAYPGKIIWQHDEADREEGELRKQLAVVEVKLARAIARKLDWRNVAIG
jgi:hypothetical protein